MKKRILCALIFMYILLTIPICANAFSARTTAPSSNSEYWYNGSYNPYYSSGYAGQCTWYVWGRAYEITGSRPTYFPAAGGAVYDACKSSGYSYGSTPKTGSIMCTNNHVAIVEAINGDSMTISEHNWKVSQGFSTEILSVSASSAGNYRSGQLIYGYIYLGSFDDATPPTITKVWFSDVTRTTFTVNITANDDSGLSQIGSTVWSAKNGKDDQEWNSNTCSGTSATTSISYSTSNHSNTTGTYLVKATASDTSWNTSEIELSYGPYMGSYLDLGDSFTAIIKKH